MSRIKLNLNPIGYLYHFNQDIFLSVYDGISIGRERGNIMIASDALLSELHCDFKVDDKKVILRDLDSDNGVKLNGKFITEKKLCFEDAIEVGNQKFRFVKKKREMDENQFVRSYNPFVLPFLPHKWSALYWSWSLILIVIALISLSISHLGVENLPNNSLSVLSLQYTILLGIYYVFGVTLNILEWKLINPRVTMKWFRLMWKTITFLMILIGMAPTLHFLTEDSGHRLMQNQNHIVFVCREQSSTSCLREIHSSGKDLPAPWLVTSNVDALAKFKKSIKKKYVQDKSKAKRELLKFIKQSRRSKSPDEIVFLSGIVLERANHLRYGMKRSKRLIQEAKKFKEFYKKRK